MKEEQSDEISQLVKDQIEVIYNVLRNNEHCSVHRIKFKRLYTGTQLLFLFCFTEHLVEMTQVLHFNF